MAMLRNYLQGRFQALGTVTPSCEDNLHRLSETLAMVGSVKGSLADAVPQMIAHVWLIQRTNCAGGCLAAGHTYASLGMRSCRMSATEARASSFFCLRSPLESVSLKVSQLPLLKPKPEPLSIGDDLVCENTLASASSLGAISEHQARLAVASSRHCSDRGSRPRSLSAHVRGCQPWLATTWCITRGVMTSSNAPTSSSGGVSARDSSSYQCVYLQRPHHAHGLQCRTNSASSRVPEG